MSRSSKIKAHVSLSSQNPQIAALKEYVLKDNMIKKIEADIERSPSKIESFVVFISICNIKSRALVFKGTGKTLDSAWKNADQKASEFAAQKAYDVIWAKADIVTSANEISTVDLNKEIVRESYQYFYRKGIAFSGSFDIAFLEAELNGNKMINYYTERQIADNQINYNSIILNRANINLYRKKYYNRDPVNIIPNKILTFTTAEFFCGEDLTVHELYNKGLDCGRRVIDIVDDKVIEAAVVSASEYLYRQIQPDGKFIYGYFPIFDNQMTSYNILRHTSSIWSLITLYRMTNNRELIPKLKSSIDYLINGFIEYKDDKTAYVVERKADEIKIGGNAVGVIMLTQYMDTFGTEEYTDLVRNLANGILELEDPDKGIFYHVLNYPDYTRKEEVRTVYYDGEAAFALTRAYMFTKDEKYLHGASAAIENFIENDYTKYRDHWVAYALHEITKYIPDERYYEFALKNVMQNLKRIYYQETSYHTYLELLLTGWQTYKRILDDKIKLDYLNQFDVESFAQTIYQRARHMLNGYFYPEYAMYMKNPERIVDTFFVRHDHYRVRIDDVQHFIGGYYFYTKYYTDILPHLSEKFLSEINK